MWTERVDGCVERNTRVLCRLCMVPLVTSVESIAGELGKDLNAGCECHSALNEAISTRFSAVGIGLTTKEAVMANGTSLHHG